MNRTCAEEVVRVGRNVRERCYHWTHLLEGNLNGERYLEILNDIIIPHLRYEFGDRFNRLWWAKYGAPTHRRVIVLGRLNEVFYSRVIALGHETEWPPRSPDITPCDFFL